MVYIRISYSLASSGSSMSSWLQWRLLSLAEQEIKLGDAGSMGCGAALEEDIVE